MELEWDLFWWQDLKIQIYTFNNMQFYELLKDTHMHNFKLWHWNCSFHYITPKSFWGPHTCIEVILCARHCSWGQGETKQKDRSPCSCSTDAPGWGEEWKVRRSSKCARVCWGFQGKTTQQARGTRPRTMIANGQLWCRCPCEVCYHSQEWKKGRTQAMNSCSQRVRPGEQTRWCCGQSLGSTQLSEERTAYGWQGGVLQGLRPPVDCVGMTWVPMFIQLDKLQRKYFLDFYHLEKLKSLRHLM